MKALHILIVSLALFSGSALAQNYPKVPIYLSASPSKNDRVGQQLIFELREALRGATAMKLVERGSSPHIYLDVTTVGLLDGQATAVAFALAYNRNDLKLLGLLIGSNVLTCPGGEEVRCARIILRNVDEAVDALRKMEPGLAAALR